MIWGVNYTMSWNTTVQYYIWTFTKIVNGWFHAAVVDSERHTQVRMAVVSGHLVQLVVQGDQYLVTLMVHHHTVPSATIRL